MGKVLLCPVKCDNPDCALYCVNDIRHPGPHRCAMHLND